MTSLLDPGHLLATFGFLGVLVIVFIETGLLVGFFLPGDSLLFTSGVLAAQALPFVPIQLLLVAVPVAAILGDQLGYQIGRSAGPAVFERRSAKRLGPAQLERSRAFFARHGRKAVLFARFVPVVRTVTPVMAGASVMPRREFTVYNVLGGLLWGAGVPLLGFTLGGIPFVRAHIEFILIGIVVMAWTPLVIGYVRSRRAVGAAEAA